MAVNFQNEGQAASVDEITSLEALLRVPLPKDYKAFLTRRSGAEPENNIFWINENYACSVRSFFAISELLTVRKAMGDEIPSNFLPIADDDSGNYICLDLSSGVVLFWDHELPEPLTQVAESFDEFCEGLEPLDPSTYTAELKDGESVWIDPNFKHLFPNFNPDPGDDDKDDRDI